MKQPETDKVYAMALAKTLTMVSSPATVGLYSSCQDRLNLILEHMKEIMDQEAAKSETTKQARVFKCNPKTSGICGFFTFLFRVFFYRPEWTKSNPHTTRFRFIYVDFSAWHFAGSDLLWAGIAMRLLETVQNKFGKIKLGLFRTTQLEMVEVKKKRHKTQDSENGPNRWLPKKICCFPLWVICLAAIMIPIFFLIIHIVTQKTGPLISGLLSSLIPAAYKARFSIRFVMNLIYSQVVKIRRAMDTDKLSCKLGFMNDVREEMCLLSRFIQFMEVFEGRRIHIVLKITNLERCDSQKIVNVLDAMNILLSDKESPLISILAVDPHVLLDKINCSNGQHTKQDRAYALLNRILTLAFTVPVLDTESRGEFFNSIKDDHISKNKENKENRNPKSSDSIALSKVEVRDPEEGKPLNVNEEENEEENEKNVKKLVLEIVEVSKKRLSQYMDDDTIFMKRVITSIWVSVIITKALKKELPKPEYMGAWLVLANQWPCRLSWIIQIVEGKNQAAGAGGITDKSITLLEVFNESRDELFAMRSQITGLLEQDGDPEMFEKLLGEKDFGFTVLNLEKFQSVLVNLDQSVKRELGQIRSTTHLKISDWKRSVPPLPLATISNMTMEQICQEMNKLKFDKKYVEIVRSNNINGPAMVFGDVQDLKALLGMNFGEWATFKLHFLGVPPQK